MRIVHMTAVHKWDDNRIYNKMCRSLALQGNEVHLVAVMGKNHDQEIIDGVIFHAVSKPTNRGERFLKTTPAVLEKAGKIKGDIYHFHDPEFLPYISGFRSSVGKPVIYDVHEDYPAAMLSKGWLPGFSRPAISKIVDVLEKKMAKNVDGIIVAWPRIIARFKDHPLKILINNYPYRDELQVNENDIKKRRQGLFVYVGVLSPERGILEMVKAVAMNANFKLILGGNWTSEEYRKKCQADHGWAACEYRGYLNRTEMRDLYAVAQAGIIAFFPEPNHLYSMPNKIFEYMSAGLPVIASDLPVQRAIVEETGCGVAADAESPMSIFEKMQWIYDNPDKAEKMGSAGRKAILGKLNWEVEMTKLINFYNQVQQ